MTYYMGSLAKSPIQSGKEDSNLLVITCSSDSHMGTATWHHKQMKTANNICRYSSSRHFLAQCQRAGNLHEG